MVSGCVGFVGLVVGFWVVELQELRVSECVGITSF